MPKSRRRISPSTILATTALIAATGGTAIAAEEVIITSPQQVAPGILDGGHIERESLTKNNLQGPAAAAARPGGRHQERRRRRVGHAGDREPEGVYDVTFSSSILNGGTGESGDTLVNENCAVTATARSAAAPPATAVDVLPVVFVLRTTGPNTVRVSTIDPTRAQGDRLVDTAFDITANC